MKVDFGAIGGNIHVADGGWSTQLLKRGIAPGQVPELAGLTDPALVKALAHEYVQAGVQFLTTNTFCGNRLMLEKRGVDVNVTELNRTAARLLAEEFGNGAAVIVGAIGPTGRILAVRETSEAELVDAYREQAEALAAGGVDVLLLETFSELEEILLAVGAIRKTLDLPIIASMSYDAGPQRTQTMMGARAEECAAALDDAGVAAIGCNCGGGIQHALPAVVALRNATNLPLWAKPNAGLPDLEQSRPVYRQTPEEFAKYVPDLLDAGVNIIGGCCGTGPEHIRRVAALVASRKRSG